MSGTQALPSLGTCTLQADEELLTAISEGNPLAMEKLHDRHSTLVYSVALGVLHDPDSAEDVLFDVFITLWRAAKIPILTAHQFTAWLAISSHRLAMAVLAKSPTP